MTTPLTLRHELQLYRLRIVIHGPSSVLSPLRSLLLVAPDWLCSQPETETTTFVVHLAASPESYHEVSRDGAHVWATKQLHDIVAYLESAINSAVSEHLRDYIQLHAGVVAWENRGLLFPAASGSGKTTLVAGLVAAGARYLSDEAAVIDPATGRLLPFAKSLYVRAGALDVLTKTFPELAARSPYHQPNGDDTWYLPPRPEWLPREPVAIRSIVLPAYRPGARSAMKPLPRSITLQRLLDQSFNLRAHRAQGIGRLVSLLQDIDCYQLTYGRLDDAVALVHEQTSGD